jgi:hypothetical protein
VAGFRWICDDKPIPGGEDKVEFDCDDIGKHVFSLVVLDPAGVPSEPETHSVHVYRLWAVVMIGFLALAAGGFVWWLYSGNDPRFWTYKTIVSEDDAFSARQANESLAGIAGISLKSKWSMLSKCAKMTLADLAHGQSVRWLPNTRRGSTVVAIEEAKIQLNSGSKGERGPDYEFVGDSSNVSLATYFENQLARFRSALLENEGEGTTSLWLRIEIPKRVPTTHLWIRIAWTVLLLFLACAGCTLFAF